MPQRTLPIIEVGVNDRIAQLLDRVSNLKLAKNLTRPVRFDRDGEQHARSVAARDAASSRRCQNGVSK